MNWRLVSCILGFVLLVGLMAIGLAFPLEALFHLALGWGQFLWNVLPQVRVDSAGVVTAVVTLVGFSLGFHFIARWLASALGTPANAGQPGWTWQKTVRCSTLVLVAFVAGIAMTGMAHQATWLATGSEPILVSGFEAAQRTQSKNHLKQIGMALQDHHDREGAFPAGATFDAYEQPLHGWQTALLPFLDQRSLFQRIDQTVPWNSPRNAEALATELPVFQNPAMPPIREQKANASGRLAISHYAGNAWLLGDRPQTRKGIRDEAANTIFAGEVAVDCRPWGQPMNVRDPSLGLNRSPAGFGSTFRGGCHLLMADGSIRFLSEAVSPNVLKALATPAGGETIDD